MWMLSCVEYFSYLIQKCIHNQQLFQNSCWNCINFWINWELEKLCNTKMIGWTPFSRSRFMWGLGVVSKVLCYGEQISHYNAYIQNALMFWIVDCFLNQIFSFEPLTEKCQREINFFPFSFVERHLTQW